MGANDHPQRDKCRTADNTLDTLFEAIAQAVGEAIINAMVAAELMVGRDGRIVAATEHDALKELMRN